LHARNRDLETITMMTVQTIYFSTSLDNNADTNGTTELMLLISDMNDWRNWIQHV